MSRGSFLTSLAVVSMLWSASTISQTDRSLRQPDHPEMTRPAPAVSHVRLETMRGAIRLEMRREWSPHGVDPVFFGGNEYLQRNFPKLDYIRRATVEQP